MGSKTLNLSLRIFNSLSYKRKISVLTILPLAIITGISDVLVVGLISRLFNAVVGNENRPSIPFSDLFSTDPFIKIIWLIIIYICINWLASILKIILRAFQERLRALIFIDLSELAQEKIFKQRYEFFLSERSEDISNKILLNISRVSEKFIRPILQIVSGFFIVFFIFLAILSFLKATAFYLIISLLIGYTIISLIVTPIIRKSAKQRIILESEISKVMTESIRTIIDVHLSNSEQFFKKRFKKSSKNAFPYLWRAETLPEFPRALIEPFGITLIFSIGVFPLLSGKDPKTLVEIVPFIATIAVSSLKLTPPLQDLFRGITDLRSGIPDVEETLKIIELKSERSYFKKKSCLNFKPPKKNIALDSVNYKYPFNERFSIKNVNLNISVGSKVAFVGKTGSGKSTTANQILSLLTPTSGNLLLDGGKLEKENINAWQALCSYVPQSINLLNEDFLSNIAYGKDNSEIDEERVSQAIKIAQLKELIKDLPNGLNTKVGENGIRLSGGQRQRIAIARALYRETKLLVLDEATSSLDNQTEASIINSIQKVKDDITVLVIAHRLSTVKDCDCIYVFEKGQIISKGTYHELLEKSPTFKSLIDSKNIIS